MRARKHNGLRISFLRNMSNFAFKGKKIYASILYIVSVYLKFKKRGGFWWVFEYIGRYILEMQKFDQFLVTFFTF